MTIATFIATADLTLQLIVSPNVFCLGYLDFCLYSILSLMQSLVRSPRNRIASCFNTPSTSLLVRRGRPAPGHLTTNLLKPLTQVSSMSSSSTKQSQPAEAKTSASAEASTAAKPELPPLSPQEYKAYNRLAEVMDYFVCQGTPPFRAQRANRIQHDHFRRSWDLLYTAATTGKRPGGMTLKQFLDEGTSPHTPSNHLIPLLLTPISGLSLVKYLETHHGIEETYLFPLLARKMPQFRATGGQAELLRQHKQIHKGMDVFEEYVKKCRNRETELEMSMLKEKMDSWGGVLLKHLDQEVETLGAENMRTYWTVEEMKGFPI